MSLDRGRYFIINDHPAFILTDPFTPQEKKEGHYIIYANASSVKNSYGEKRRHIDRTCLLKKGDHYSIIRDSYIIYKRARCISTNHEALQNLPLAMQSQGQDAFLTPAILMKICKGLMQSTLARSDVKDFYRQAVEQGRAYPVV